VGCGPLLAPPAARVTHGCPSEFRVVLLFDRVRADPEAGRWLLRVIAIAYTQNGRSAEISDLAITRAGDRYAVDSETVLASID